MTGIAQNMSKSKLEWNLYNRFDLYGRIEAILLGGFRMRRRTTPKFWAFMIVVTVVVFGISFGVMQLRYAQGARQLDQVRAYRDELTLQVQDLNAELAYAQTDDYVMRAARDQLGLIMPSEVRYVNRAN